jgi:Flp pilus assembly pilin Flp
MNFLKKALKNKKGQGVMEYVIISSLVGIVCIVAVKGFGSTIKNRVEEMQKQIKENVKT